MADNTTLSANNKLILVAAMSCSCPHLLMAGELDIKPSINTTGYVYQTDRGTQENVNNQAILVKPRVMGIYSARKASASVVVDHSYVKQHNDDPGADKNFTELRYLSGVNLIDHIMSLSLSGDHSYRALDASQGFVSDKVLAAGELSKVRTNTARLNLSVPKPQYLGATLQTLYSTTNSEETIDSTRGLDGENMLFDAQIYQGSKFRRTSFYLASRYNDTSRASGQDFTSTISNARLGFGLTQDIKFVLVGSDSQYDIDEQSLNTQRRNLDTTSYGAGFLWQPRDDRSIEITYNNLDEDENSSRFVGLNTNWAFSSRSAVQFGYSKRFYGDAYDFGFRYNLKSFRSSASYSESVTSFSRLSIAEGPTNVFVCALGSTDLADCFQPNSLDYVLQPGEEYRQAGFLFADITDEILFRKAGRLSLGYDKRRLKAALSLSMNTTEFLESERQQESKTLGLSLNYKLGRRTSLGLNTNFSTVNYSGSDRQNDVINLSASFSRTLSKQLSMDVTARYLDREAEDISRDLTDTRLTVGINYKFY